MYTSTNDIHAIVRNSMLRSRYLISRSLRNSEPTSNNLFKITTVISGKAFAKSTALRSPS